MDIPTLTTLINTMGFPIVVCGTLFWFLKTLLDRALILLSEFKTAVNENTNSIQTLIRQLDEVKNVQINK